ncbi:hypothetical protein [Myroides sp. LJL119]
MKKFIYRTENGFFIIFFNKITKILNDFNLVKSFKELMFYICCGEDKGSLDSNDRRRIIRFAIDVFVILKWLFLLIIIILDFENCFTTVFIWYLLFYNLYTYFYYHIWKDENMLDTMDLERIKSRFINLMLSIAFSNVCFAYLYKYPYSSSFQWGPNGELGITNSIWYSFANSLTVSYDLIKPLDATGFNIATLQVIVSFVFLTIILSNSIPKIK